MIKSVLFYFLFRLILSSVASQLRTDKYTVLPKGFWSNISSNSLIYGHHFTFCCHEMPGGLKITRDTIGRTIAITGVEGGLIDWLSRKYQFTFDCIARDLQTVENIGFSLGSMNYLENGECEIIASPMVMRHDRFLQIDFLHPLTQTPYSMLIPRPQAAVMNIEAIWKPFQPSVWIVILVFIVLTTSVLTLFHVKKAGRICYGLPFHTIFVIKTIISQPASISPDNSMRLKTRLVMGAWCLVGLCLTTAYSSVLVSFIIAPHYRSLVDTLEDLAQSEDVNPLVVQDLAADVTISKSNDLLMEKIAEKLNRDPSNNRCPNITDCLQQVKRGSHVFINVMFNVHPLMECFMLGALEQMRIATRNDFIQTRKCNFAYARETFYPFYYSWGIQKGHPLKELLNQGILRAIETGLMDVWRNRNSVVNYNEVCKSIHHIKHHTQETQHPLRLSLPNLMGPFIILLTGHFASLLVFGSENLIHYCILRLR